MQTPYRYSVPAQVRFRDTDAMGHVNNAVYLTFLEIARTAYWTDLFTIESYNDVDFVVARVEIDFLAPLFVNDEIDVRIRVSELGTRSFRFAYEVVRRSDGECAARAASIQVMYDYESGRSKPLSDEQRARILAFEDAAAVTIRD